MVILVLNSFLLFLGLIATGFLVFGGFEYVTSAGNDQAVGKAKKVIIYAAVGIIIILLAAVIVNALIGIPVNQTASSQ
jgi:TRAP-type C4-dicarboxylate transport system permease small subunit